MGLAWPSLRPWGSVRTLYPPTLQKEVITLSPCHIPSWVPGSAACRKSLQSLCMQSLYWSRETGSPREHPLQNCVNALSSGRRSPWCEEPTHWKRPWCWERLRAGGEGGGRGWDGWMASPTWWTWFWANSERWWRTGKPGMLYSLGSQRVGRDLMTEWQKGSRCRYWKWPEWSNFLLLSCISLMCAFAHVSMHTHTHTHTHTHFSKWDSRPHLNWCYIKQSNFFWLKKYEVCWFTMLC